MKYLSLLLTVIFMIGACGQGDKQQRLRELEAQRDAITAEIEQLREELQTKDPGMTNQNVEHVTVKQVVAGEHRHYIKIQGMVESDHNILIPAQYSGVVKKIHVTEGDKVRKDQLLAELDGAILANTLAEVEANLELARTVFERQKRLWEKNIGSEIQYLQAKTNLEALEKRKAAVEEQYELTRVTSPINGTVDDIATKEGEAVAAGFGTIRVVENTKLVIEADLSEDHVGNVKTGDAVAVKIPVAGKIFESTLRSVSRVIDPKNRTFKIEVSIPGNIDDLKPNMMAVLTIKDYHNTKALVIPVNISQRSGEKPFIFVARPDENDDSGIWTVERRDVQLAWPTAENVQVTDGLAQGEYVVVSGYQDLAHGQKVKAHTEPIL
jgi:RND family efflux transporter MFP subunit